MTAISTTNISVCVSGGCECVHVSACVCVCACVSVCACACVSPTVETDWELRVEVAGETGEPTGIRM